MKAIICKRNIRRSLKITAVLFVSQKEADTEFATCLYTEHGHLVPKDQLDCRYKICTAHLKFIQGIEKAEHYWRKSVQPKGRVRVVGGECHTMLICTYFAIL